MAVPLFSSLRARPRSARRLAAHVVVMWLLGLCLVASPMHVLPAHAAGDSVDSFDIEYTVNKDGTVDATETIVWRFGDDSGRRGILREFVSREPEKDDRTKDIVYRYSDFTVESPDAPDQFAVEHGGGLGDRVRTTTLRIGDPESTVGSDTATYVISYKLEGALRGQDEYDEFYWDAVGTGWQATLNDVTVTVDIPGGVQDARCYIGEMGSTTECDRFGVTDGTYRATQERLSAGEGLTVGAMITKGAVDNASPILEASFLDRLRTEAVDKAKIGGVLAAIAAVLTAIGGRLTLARRRDLRYLNLPAGTVPGRGDDGRVGPSSRGTVIPVAFEPPELDVAAAGWLHDAKLTGRETAATLISMAVRGVLHIAGDSRQGYRLTLLDASLARGEVEEAVVSKLFPVRRSGAVRALHGGSSLRRAHVAMSIAVRSLDEREGWWLHRPGDKFVTPLGRVFSRISKIIGVVVTIGLLLAVLLVGSDGAWADNEWVRALLQRLRGLDPWLLLWIIPVVLVMIPIRFGLNLTAKAGSKRGQRSARGRAMTDRVEGFRQYLATAEADQLQFEEGRDIYSEFLPWAIAFGLTDRWSKVCQQLVEQGRIPQPSATWWDGGRDGRYFDSRDFERDVRLSTAPPSSSSSSVSSSRGTGGGSRSSSFSSRGGSSGGGGGGGGGSSW